MEIVEVSVLPKLSLLFQENRIDEINAFFFQISAFFSVFLSAFGLLTYLYYDDLATEFRPNFLGYRLVMLLLILAYFVYIVGRIYILYFRVFLNSKPEFYYAVYSFIFMFFSLPSIYYINIFGAAFVYCIVPILSLVSICYKFGFRVYRL
jgi:uncharacterized protein with PQ loop repeat